MHTPIEILKYRLSENKKVAEYHFKKMAEHQFEAHQFELKFSEYLERIREIELAIELLEKKDV